MTSGERDLVSVIIPTFGRPDVLDECISRLLKQDYPHLEILVIHDGQGCPHYEDDRIIVDHRDEPQGSPAAKNRGIEKSSGEIIIFIDDDSLPISNDWVNEYVHAFRKSGQVVAGIGGFIEEDQPFSEREGTGRINHNRLGFYRIVSGFQAETELNVDHLKSCNFAVRRQVLGALEEPYFDPRFEGNAHREETDFSIRIRDAGFKLRYTPKCGVIHQHAESGGQRGSVSGKMGSAYWSGINEALLFYKHFFSGWGSVLVFLVQETIFNRFLPQYQIAKFAGVLRGLVRHRSVVSDL